MFTQNTDQGCVFYVLAETCSTGWSVVWLAGARSHGIFYVFWEHVKHFFIVNYTYRAVLLGASGKSHIRAYIYLGTYMRDINLA